MTLTFVWTRPVKSLDTLTINFMSYFILSTSGIAVSHRRHQSYAGLCGKQFKCKTTLTHFISKFSKNSLAFIKRLLGYLMCSSMLHNYRQIAHILDVFSAAKLDIFRPIIMAFPAEKTQLKFSQDV